MGLVQELRRRNVFRVGIAYSVTAWLIAQIADLALDAFGAPTWIVRTILLLLVLGFPVALLFAWAYELTPEGLKRESDVDRTNSITGQTGQRLNKLVIGMLVLACGFILVDKLYLQKVPDGASTDVTIAVLPFENRSSVKEDAYFVEGIHDDLLSRLSRVGVWRVISRTSVEQIPELDLSIPEIAERLGATHVIEGSVQRSNDAVRVIVQLIDARTDSHVWAPDPFDRELTAESVFAIQSEIAISVAKSLRTVLTVDDEDRVTRIGTHSLEAYDKYLQGRESLWERTGESVNAAVELFEAAVTLDPEFADGWTGLGDAYRFQNSFSGLPAEQAMPPSESALRRAVKLDPKSGEAWAGLAATLRSRGDSVGAELAFEKSIALNPNYANGRMWYGLFLIDRGRLSEAIEQYEAVLAIDPLNPVVRTNMTAPYMDLGEFQRGREVIQEQVAMFPQDKFAPMLLAGLEAFYFARFDKAVESAERTYSTHPNGLISAALAGFYLDLGDFEETRKWLQRHRADGDIAWWSEELAAYLNLYTGGLESACSTAESSLARTIDSGSSREDTLILLRDCDVSAQELGPARKRYENFYPDLFLETPVVTVENAKVAADIAWLEQQAGFSDRANDLARRAIKVSQGRIRNGRLQLGIARARSQVILGNETAAIQELAGSIDDGWRANWLYVFDFEPAFASLRDNPEFAALRDRVATDMSMQLETVRMSTN